MGLAWAAIAAVLVARAGLYPAVMTGDEIWFSESALNLIRHGVPQRLIHHDAVGSATADFLPPVIMLVQALAFLVLGLTPGAVAAQSVAAPLATVVLLCLIARRAGAPVIWSGLAGIAVLASPSFLRADLYIRYEALVALCLLVYLLATRLAQGRRPGPWHAARGVALALAGLSYYPLAPFIGLAALVFEVRRWRAGGEPVARRLRGLTLMAAGFAVPALLFGAYVLHYPDIFAAQILGNGSANYLAFELPRRLLDADFWRQSKDALPELVALAAFLVALCRHRGTLSPWARDLHVAALITSLPALLFPFYPRLLAAPICLVLLILVDATTSISPTLRRVGRVVLALGTLGAVASCALMTTTAIIQQDARRYDTIAAALDRLVTAPGAVAIDQRAWLALRAADPTRELDHVVPAGASAQVRIFEPTILTDPAGGDRFRYIVLDAADAEPTIAATPALAAAFAAHRFVEVGRVAPPFHALPWASQPPYDLIVYARRD